MVEAPSVVLFGVVAGQERYDLAGEGGIARLIKERAEAAGVPLVEDPKLSYLLSKIPLGDEIPPELYRAVAEVLVFVLRLEKSIETQA